MEFGYNQANNLVTRIYTTKKEIPSIANIIIEKLYEYLRCNCFPYFTFYFMEDDFTEDVIPGGFAVYRIDSKNKSEKIVLIQYNHIVYIQESYIDIFWDYLKSNFVIE